MRGWLVAISMTVVLGLIALCVWLVHSEGHVEPFVRDMGLRYHPVSMRGFRGKLAGVGVEFDSMDVRKARSGGITFGGFNVLEMDNLRLTLYPSGVASSNCVAQGSSVVLPYEKAPDLMSAIGSFVSPGIKVAGVKIRHLSVFRVSGNPNERPILWLESDELHNVGAQLRLDGLCLNESGMRRMLGKARLIVRDGYYIAYGESFSKKLKLF